MTQGGKISSINLYGTNYTIGLSDIVEEELYEKFLKKMAKAPILEHKCNSCGGVLEMSAEKHLFVCPYCGSCYAVGTSMVWDKGE